MSANLTNKRPINPEGVQRKQAKMSANLTNKRPINPEGVQRPQAGV